MFHERIEYDSCTKPVHELIEKIKNGTLILRPKYQRNYIWNDGKRKSFITSCYKNIPCPSVGVNSVVKDGKQLWETRDGQQRLTTLLDFMNDNFTDVHERKYSELSPIEQNHIRDYKIVVTYTMNATLEQEIEMFDVLQDAKPLSRGERLHAKQFGNNPLLHFTLTMLMKTEAGVVGDYYKQAQNVWGKIKCGDESKRHKELSNLTALMNGIVHGWSKSNNNYGITEKYDELRSNLSKPISETMKSDANKVLKELFQIYEGADARKPLNGKERNKNLCIQKAIGNFTGAIVYSLKKYPDNWERLHNEWVEFIVMYRNDNTLLKTVIHNNLSSSSSWNEERWSTTYEKVREFVSRDT